MITLERVNEIRKRIDNDSVSNFILNKDLILELLEAFDQLYKCSNCGTPMHHFCDNFQCTTMVNSKIKDVLKSEEVSELDIVIQKLRDEEKE